MRLDETSGRRGWLVLCGLLACLDPSGFAAASPGTQSEPQEFKVEGVVKRIDPSEQRVVIEHKEIPDFMPAMTMPFRVKTTNELAGVEAGSTVSFRLLVTEDESWIDRIVTVQAAAAPPTPEPAAQISQAAPATGSRRHPLLDYAFTNELGQAVRLGDFRGKALAITFIFTRCPIPDYCPRLSKNFEEAIQKLRTMPDAPTNWHFLSVTFDPEFDTPSVLKAYGKRYGYDPRYWSFLTGPTNKIAELARLSDVKFERDGIFFNHNLRTLIIDPTGQLRMNFPIGGDLADAIVAEILKVTSVTNQVAKVSGDE